MRATHCARVWLVAGLLVCGTALSALVTGCGTVGQSSTVESGALCPTCNRKVARFHPKRGTTYRKVACPSCGTVRVLDTQVGTDELVHMCERCGQLVDKCPECRKQADPLKQP